MQDVAFEPCVRARLEISRCFCQLVGREAGTRALRLVNHQARAGLHSSRSALPDTCLSCVGVLRMLTLQCGGQWTLHEISLASVPLT